MPAAFPAALQGVGEDVGGGQLQAAVVGGLECRLAQSLPCLPLAIPLEARQVLEAVSRAKTRS